MLMLYCPCLSCHCDCVFDCECDCVVSWSAVHGLRSDDLSLRMLLWCARQDWILTRGKDEQMETLNQSRNPAALSHHCAHTQHLSPYHA